MAVLLQLILTTNMQSTADPEQHDDQEHQTLCSQKSMYNILFPQNLTTVVPWYLREFGSRIPCGFQNLQILKPLQKMA